MGRTTKKIVTPKTGSAPAKAGTVRGKKPPAALSKSEQFVVDMMGIQFGSKMDGYDLPTVVAEMRNKYGASEVDTALKSLGVDVSGIAAAPPTNVVSQAGDATGAVVPVTSSDGSLPPVPASVATAAAAASKPAGRRKGGGNKRVTSATVAATPAAGATAPITAGAGTVVPSPAAASPSQPAPATPAMDMSKLANPLTPDQQAALAGIAQQSSQAGGSQKPVVQGSPSFWKRIGMNPPASTGVVGMAGAKSLYQNLPTIANVIGGGVGTALAVKYGGPAVMSLFRPSGEDVDDTDEVLNEARRMYMQQGNFGN